ncbi:hypothetical protein SAMN05216167_101833 [Spirosoma endophyticum]|uniref:Uncharacterized protein n=1 Tax=Spirosoma endophyticum TaxID=662367 RepID=A0A1I1I329_9BACT|nr:hypothetical protein SAMN05216167_101833 [Spirosoma endophyticum]
MNIAFGIYSSFERIAQFYVAENGIRNYNSIDSIDCFGYGAQGSNSNRLYLRTETKERLFRNGGHRVRQPAFNNLRLSSASKFSLAAGIFIDNSLGFNRNGLVKTISLRRLLQVIRPDKWVEPTMPRACVKPNCASVLFDSRIVYRLYTTLSLYLLKKS